MTPALHAALLAVRTGHSEIAEVAHPHLAPIEQHRLALALALRAGDRAASLECAELLWTGMAVDPTVLATLVAYDHPALGAPARVLLERLLSAVSRDLAPAWRTLATDPGALDAWRDVIETLVARGSPLQAIDGVARALRAGVAGTELWSLMTTTLLAYRCGHALIEALRLDAVPM